MKNIYSVQLVKPVKTESHVHGFSGKESSNVFVIASTFATAAEAVNAKYPGVEVRGITMMNYLGMPIVIGE